MNLLAINAARHRRPANLVATICVLGLTACSPGQDEVHDLTEPPTSLPYELVASPITTNCGSTIDRTTLVSTVLFDSDGDGDLDRLIAVSDRIRLMENFGTRVAVTQEMGIQPGYGYDGRLAVHDPVDLDGSGRLVVPLSGPSADYSHWRFWFLDTRAWKVVRTLDLPAGPDHWEDGRWDGSYAVQGMLTVPTEEGDRRAVVVSSTAHRDGMLRGIRTLDPQSGEEIWSFPAGPKLDHQYVSVVDLDADGRCEVIYGGFGVGNPFSANAGGFSDKQSMVFLVEATGELRWSRSLLEEPSSTFVLVEDLDGDGSLEIVVTYGNDVIPAGFVEIWSAADGRTLAAYPHGFSLSRPLTLPAPNGTDILVRGANNRLVRLSYRDGDLRVRAAAQFGQTISMRGTGDYLGDGTWQVVLATSDDECWLVNHDLSRVLAIYKSEGFSRKFALSKLWTVNEQPMMCFLDREPGIGRVLVARALPHDRSGLLAILSGVAVILLGGFALRWARQRIGEKGTPPAPPPGLQPKRELQLRLLNDLAAENHGAIGALKIAKSLVRLVGMRHGGHLPDVQRLSRRVQDFDGQCWPRLTEILDRCEAADGPPGVVATARAEFDTMRAVIVRLDEAKFAASVVASELPVLEKAWGRGEAACRELRDDLEKRFSADPEACLSYVLDHHVGDLASVTVSAERDSGLWLRIHCDDLQPVLDNLVDNALKAMRGRCEQTITVSITDVNGIGQVDITDNGCGMPPELVAKLGHERVSSRRGGGHGWLYSTTLLECYGGSLRVVSSSPGGGTRVRLRLPVARDAKQQGDGDER